MKLLIILMFFFGIILVVHGIYEEKFQKIFSRTEEDFKKDHLHSFTTMLNKIAENERQISEKEKNIISQTNLRVNQLESKIVFAAPSVFCV